MLFSKKSFAIIFVFLSFFVSLAVQAGEGRYQAQWNGKSYFILDTDHGHMWTYQGDSLIYSGRIDGDEFDPPSSPQIWRQSHGKWSRN